jgi:hypothetical protein
MLASAFEALAALGVGFETEDAGSAGYLPDRDSSCVSTRLGCAKTGIATPAQCAPLLRLLRRRNIPMHLTISQCRGPTFPWLDRIL